MKPKDKISVTLMASDKCDLAGDPNTGSGDRYQLDVVTPEELLAMLERKELGLRRRLEQIIDELSEMRDTVSRLKSSTNRIGAAPEDQATEPQESAPDTAQTPNSSVSSRCACCARNARSRRVTNRPRKCWASPLPSPTSARN